MPVVLVTSRSFSSGEQDLVSRLERGGYTIRRGPADHSLAAIGADLAVAEGWIAGTGEVTARHLDAAPRLKVLARYGVGFESVDVRAAAERGVVVTNTPGANSNAVAEHALALMLAALRTVTEGDRRVRARDWSVIRGRELASLAVGLVGFGRIGQIVARLLGGFGSAVYASDPFLSPEQVRALGAEPLDLAGMAATCDVISLHAPGGQQLIDTAWLAATAKPVVLVNTARPELVDEAAVAAALQTGDLAAFAADTLRGDTSGQDSPVLDPQLAARVVITPHFGAQTVQAVDGMGSIAVDNLLAVLEGRTPPNPVSPTPLKVN
ncbi:NAD(P)-dependent oxidoreductase [Arthrobacter sp. Hor0625]|uniref:NAD(P)-dependent oxidoreductase n=1 Tax=Arthrobacter sp. Hor0625 TaxID=3457358 RepID=UPI00403EF39F